MAIEFNHMIVPARARSEGAAHSWPWASHRLPRSFVGYLWPSPFVPKADRTQRPYLNELCLSIEEPSERHTLCVTGGFCRNNGTHHSR
jgi:hypothetical protein